MNNTTFSDQLITWHHKYGRHDLPWQKQPTSYRVWVSEIMLQQTQVTTVIPYYQRFIKRFANIKSLAKAELDEVLSYWSGLGYYARARNLHRSAQIIQHDYQGRFPTTLEQLCQLPGIGRSTAGAILSLAQNQATPILDGNVKRVLARTHAISGWPGEPRVLKQLWQLSEHHTPTQQTARYNQAMMDLGAMICTRKQPNCIQCPVNNHCCAYQQQQQHLYPQSKQAKKVPLKATLMLILMNQLGEILLEKRPPTGIWGGLWSLPQCEIEHDISNWAKQQIAVDIIQTSFLPQFKHQFTHFHLHIQPVLLKIKPIHTIKVMENSNHLWYKKEQFSQLGLPKPVQSLLKQILNLDTDAGA